MSRLIVLSNRVKMPDNHPMAGGLAVALQDVSIGKSVVWMGWNGEVVNDNNANNTDAANTFSSIQQRFMASSKAKTRATQITNISISTAVLPIMYCGLYCMSKQRLSAKLQMIMRAIRRSIVYLRAN